MAKIWRLAAYNPNQNLQQLKMVLLAHGKVPGASPLTDWVKYLRKKYRENAPTEDEIRQIQETGLNLTIADDQHQIFLKKLTELTDAYCRNTPLSPVMNSFRGTIRRQFHKKTLKKERLELILAHQEKYDIDILGTKASGHI